jgi:hypothetical protein
MILFTPASDPSTEPGEGAEVVLDPSGKMVDLRNVRGGSIPDDGSVLSGTGEGADWLRAHAQPGLKVRVQARFQAGGASLGGKTGVVNGGPRLLRGGVPDITA